MATRILTDGNGLLRRRMKFLLQSFTCPVVHYETADGLWPISTILPWGDVVAQYTEPLKMDQHSVSDIVHYAVAATAEYFLAHFRFRLTEIPQYGCAMNA